MNKKNSYSVPGIITNQLYDYLSEENVNLPFVRIIKIIYDYLKTIKLIYSEDQAKQIVEDTKKKLIDLIALTIINNPSDDGTIELSKAPEVLIHYKKVDSHNIVYRINFMKKVGITDWKLVDAKKRGIAPEYCIAEDIFSLAEKLLE